MNNFFVVIYLVSIILYVSQGVLFEGTWFTFLSGIYLLAFNMFCTFKVAFKQNRSIFRYLLLFSGWIVLLWLISPKAYLHQGVMTSTSSMVQYSVMVCTSAFAFFYISSNKLIKGYQIETFILTIGLLYVYNVLFFDVAANSAGYYDFSHVNNKSYSIVALFPMFTLFWKRKWLMLILMSMALFLVVLCLKRGAIIIALACYVVVLFRLFKDNGKSFVNKKIVQISVILLFVGLWYMLNNIYESNDYLQGRMELTLEGGSSGRDLLYLQIWDAWLNSDLLHQMLGHGPIATLSASIKYAHNDWLEILFDFGFIGFLLYVIICLGVFRVYNNPVLSKQQKTGVILCLLYIILRSSFSMCIYELDSIMIYGFIGYVLGDNYLSLNNS